MTILGVDTSHFQGLPNWAQVRASGRSFGVLKASEGTTFADPTLGSNRANARAAGMVVGLYHFARAGNAAAEAAWFLKTIGALQPGEFLVLDWEVSYANPPAWCKAWLDAVTAATGVHPLIYMNQSAAAGSNWSAVAAGYGLWLAKYDNSTAQPSVAGWPAVAMKQYSSSGTVPGIAGACDVDVFYGSQTQLLAYGFQGDDMPAYSQWSKADKDALLNDIRDWSVPPALAKFYGDAGDGALIMNGLQVLVQQICGEKATLAIPFPGADKGGGWPLTPPDAGSTRYTPVMFLQALLNKSSANVDPQALADALVANPDAVGKLADALAAALAQRLQS